MGEGLHFGEFDLPRSVGYVIARLIKQKFPREFAAVNRDGTLLINFDDIDKAQQNETVELKFGRNMFFTYERVLMESSSGIVKCKYCGSDYTKTVYYATYVLTKIQQGAADLTERYKIGGDLTETYQREKLKQL